MITYIAILSLLLIGANSQSANDFCQAGPPGQYCNANGNGYYWCTANGNWLMNCAAGTSCLCFQGPECQTVLTVGSGSPCGWPPVSPKFRNSFSGNQFIKFSQNVPVGRIFTNSSTSIYVNGEIDKERVDTISNTYTTFNTESNAHTKEYYFLNSDNTVTHYKFDVLASTCTSEVISGPLPNTRVPQGYQLLRTENVGGRDLDVYYYRNGGRIPAFEGGLTDFFYVTQNIPAMPVFRNTTDSRWRNTQFTETTWTNFVNTKPAPSVFNLPAQCN